MGLGNRQLRIQTQALPPVSYTLGQGKTFEPQFAHFSHSDSTIHFTERLCVFMKLYMLLPPTCKNNIPYAVL